MEFAIKDAEGQRLPAGEQGEICVRGPAVFAGYHNNPEANAKALKEGWFHTGDLGRLDERGFLYITGRASDMYISRSEEHTSELQSPMSIPYAVFCLTKTKILTTSQL